MPIDRTGRENVKSEAKIRCGIRRPLDWLGAAALAAGLAVTPNAAGAQVVRAGADQADPRIGLAAGWQDAAEAESNIFLVSHRDRPRGFFDSEDLGSISYANTDLALQGDYAFVGSYNGFNVYNVADPLNPELQVSVVCPGGQGDLSVHGDLLFMSVEETRDRLDCGLSTPEEAVEPVDADRFRGVRIFDISDIGNPVQVAAVQTCRGSHTHTIVSDPDDLGSVYVYVSGTGGVRSGAELEGCLDIRSPDEPDTSFWRISVIEVPLDAPQNARVVNEPRVFANPETGAIAGLWSGGDHGPGTQESSQTTSCHDMTAYPEIGLAAGACQGNGVLFDITDPVNPVRIAEVTDQNFAYWHSATFNNDGTKVIFTDEWGGGRAPRCLASDPIIWGANAVFDVIDGELHFASYRSDQSGQMEVYVQPYPGPGPTVPVSIGGGTSVTWSPDGAELTYRLDDRMMAVSFDVDGDTPRIGPPTELFRGDYFATGLGGTRQYHVAPDGRFLMLKGVTSQSSGEELLLPQVILVQNFFEELR